MEVLTPIITRGVGGVGLIIDGLKASIVSISKSDEVKETRSSKSADETHLEEQGINTNSRTEFCVWPGKNQLILREVGSLTRMG